MSYGYTLFSMVERRCVRKEHRCIWCGQKILIGDKYEDERSVYDGNIQRRRWHPECRKVSESYFKESGEEEFDPMKYERPAATP